MMDGIPLLALLCAAVGGKIEARGEDIREGRGWVRSRGRRGEGLSAVVIAKLASVAFLCSDTYSGSSSSPRRGVFITVNTKLVAGTCGAA